MNEIVTIAANAQAMEQCKIEQITYILKAIKNATGTSVIFPINISLIHFVFILTSVPNVGERCTET